MAIKKVKFEQTEIRIVADVNVPPVAKVHTDISSKRLSIEIDADNLSNDELSNLSQLADRSNSRTLT